MNDNVSSIRAHIPIPVSNYRSQLEASQSILCIVNNMGFGILCEEYAKYLRDNVCMIDVIYKFDLINIGNECEEIKYVSVYRDLNIIQKLSPDSSSENLCRNKKVGLLMNDYIDICKYKGKQIDLAIIVNKRSFPIRISIPIPLSISPFVMDQSVKCQIDGSEKSCEEYMEFWPDAIDCNVNVLFEYSLANIGYECQKIEKIFVSSEGELPILITSNKIPCQQLCMGEKISLKQYKNIDICQYAGRGISCNIFVNDNHFPINGTVAIPFPSTRSKLQVSQPLVCSIDSTSSKTSCHEYLKTNHSCIADVVYKFNITNIGDECEKIKYLSVFRDVNILTTFSSREETICKFQVYEGSAKDKINLCNFDVNDVHIRIYVNKRENPLIISM